MNFEMHKNLTQSVTISSKAMAAIQKSISPIGILRFWGEVKRLKRIKPTSIAKYNLSTMSEHTNG